METLPWHKFYTDKFLVKMHRYPNHILGKWIRVFCTMAESKDRWTLTGSVEEWARIIAETPSETRIFINYVIDHFTDVKVEIKTVSHKLIYTMTETMYKHKDSYTAELSTGVPYTRRNALTANRETMIKRVLSAYHPDKLLGRNSTFKKEFLKVMQDASRGIKKLDERITAEKIACQTMLDNIQKLSNTPEWKEPDFLPTINDWIMSRPWQTPISIIPQMKKKLSDMLVEDAKNENIK